jgi:hypothetical protein
MDLPGDTAGMAARALLVFVAAVSLIGTATGIASAAQLGSSVATVSSPSMPVRQPFPKTRARRGSA